MYARLNPQKLSTILAALRNLQNSMHTLGGIPMDVFDIAVDGGRHPAASMAGIDALCEELNTTADPVTSLLLDVRDVINMTHDEIDGVPNDSYNDSCADVVQALCELESRIKGAIHG
jgi:hypothetical protein